MAEILDSVYRVVWGAPALVLILGVGIYLTGLTGFAQFRMFPRAVGHFFKSLKPDRVEGISSFQALCTALAATAGTGNLVGVAGAIALGGPGSIFWMWVCAVLGMVTKFAEATLAVRFRVREGEQTVGGPMYMIAAGLGEKWRPLACLYCALGLPAAFGVGNATQVDALLSGVERMVNACGGDFCREDRLLLGALLGFLVGFLLLGGARRIAGAAELLVPFAAGGYLILCVGVLILRREQIPSCLSAIIRGAFSPRAVTGGVVGSFFRTLRTGVSRGVFTNEAGMGTASIAHAAARTDHPVRQGMMGMIEVFLDTMVICTMTALVILCSGVQIPYGTEPGGELTIRAFCQVYGDWAAVFLGLALCCFGFATILGWGLYGARCARFLFGASGWRWFSIAQGAVVVLSSALQTGFVWTLAEIFNGLMALPNLIALLALGGELKEILKDFRSREKDGHFGRIP